MSPQSDNFGGRAEIVLADPDGSTRSIQTSGMDTGLVTWNHDGIYFADTQADYLLNTELHRWPNPKTNVQAFALDTPDGLLSIYNDGSDGEIYTETFVQSTPNGPKTSTITGYNEILGKCDQRLVGIAPVTGDDYIKEIQERRLIANPEWDDFMLTQLYPATKSPKAALISASQTKAHDAAIEALMPCENGVLPFFATPEGKDGERLPEVYQWNTRTGKQTKTFLKNADGTRLWWDYEHSNTLSSAVFSPELDTAGRLIWYGGDGVMRATDPDTGRTSELWRSSIESPEETSPMSVYFDRDHLFVMDVPTETGPEPIIVHQFDIETGKDTIIATIRGLNERTSIDFIPRGFAVKPTTTTER